MALKGLMVIAHRYRSLLQPDQLWFILNDLAPNFLRGAHPTSENPDGFDLMGN